jgi:hypothetical protein
MSPPRFSLNLKTKQFVKSSGKATQSLKSQQGLEFQRTASTSGLMLLSQTKPTNKPPSCWLQKVKFSD